MYVRSGCSTVRRASRMTTRSLALAFGVSVALVVGPVSAAWASPGNSAIGSLLPLPEAAGPIPDAVANDVSCVSAGVCAAVGDYQDTIGITHAMAEDLSAGTWTATPILAPSNAPDYTFSSLNSVSCISAGDCVAVGDYRVSTVQSESFYAVEKSGTWARGVELQEPADADADPAESSFDSVSCLPGGVCQLLGIYALTPTALTSPIHAVVETYDFGAGLVGSPAEISQLTGQSGIDLNSISCTQEGAGGPYCVAVGAEVGQFSEEGTYVEETDGVWGEPGVLVNPRGAQTPSEFLSSVSCVGTGDCMAAGNWLSQSFAGYAETYAEIGGSWKSAVDIGEPSNMFDPFVDGVSCVSMSTCTLVGALGDKFGALHASTAQMTSGHWGQLAPAGVPSGAIPDHEFLGVSCTTGVTCSAVGYFNVGGVTGGSQAMAATWVPGSPPGAVSNFHVTSLHHGTAMFSWTPPASVGAGLSHFELTKTLSGASPVDAGPFTGDSGSVSKLSPGGTYHLSLVTVATDGQTSAAETVTVRVPATLPAAPTLERAVGIRHGLLVSWKAPKSTGGAAITSYRVYATCGGEQRVNRFPGSARHGTLISLLPGERCSVDVAAVNHVGTGPKSATRSATAKG